MQLEQVCPEPSFHTENIKEFCTEFNSIQPHSLLPSDLHAIEQCSRKVVIYVAHVLRKSVHYSPNRIQVEKTDFRFQYGFEHSIVHSVGCKQAESTKHKRSKNCNTNGTDHNSFERNTGLEMKTAFQIFLLKEVLEQTSF
jgi:hypothetical protein